MTVLRITRPLISARHSLGHAEIDSDHFAIAEWWMRATRCAPIALPFHTAGLRRVMRNHFTREAALVEATGTPFGRSHRSEHDAMLALCEDAYSLAERDWRSARRLLRDRLPRLVRDHVISMDQVAVLIINEAGQDRSLSLRHGL